MPATKPENIDQYIAGFSGHTQTILEQIRSTIKKTVPAAEETISYGIPSFTLDGRYLIYFGGYKKQIGAYPAPVGNQEFEKDFFNTKRQIRARYNSLWINQFPLI
jgi:uncharacterized protein YdhG (YjbR/CyaY superfamily)